MDYLMTISTILLFASGYTFLSYAQLGLPTGTFYRGSTANILGLILMISAVALAIKFNPWWTLFIAVVGGFIISVILIKLFGSAVQLINFIILIAAIIFSIKTF